MRNLGEVMGFTGGEEVTPFVRIVLGSRGFKVLEIEQDGQKVYLSPETMKRILAWAEEEPADKSKRF